jgi:ribosomal protein S18 acetylase RimI-like enzyme
VNRLATALRSHDRAELAAMGYDEPKHALRVLLRGSCWALTAIHDDFPHAMFGVLPISAWKGQPWFLGTEEVYRHGREMIRFGLRALAEMQRQFTFLENHVGSGNDKAIRLLRRWGFTVERETVEIGGMNFHRFWKERG